HGSNDTNAGGPAEHTGQGNGPAQPVEAHEPSEQVNSPDLANNPGAQGESLTNLITPQPTFAPESLPSSPLPLWDPPTE
ncbi:hypothetical protein FRC11_014339, partial [Ceratobasidium sp. 423]